MAAFLVEDDAKRLIGRMRGLDAALSRAATDYLALFKPPKNALRLPRAAKILDELLELVGAGTVCRDERTGQRRAAPVAVWVAGIEQMLAQRDRLTLPLDGHGYLRAVVFGLAEQAAARAESRREEELRAGRHRQGSALPGSDPLTEARIYADRMVDLGVWDPAQRDDYLAKRSGA